MSKPNPSCSAPCASKTLMANETGSESERGDLPKHGDRKGSPLLYNGLASLLRGCKMILALPSSGCSALFLSFANKVYYGRVLTPNMLLNILDDHVVIHTLWPEGPTRTRVSCDW